MKKLDNVTFAHTKDTTGYLFSLVKCLSAALSCGGYEAYADDVVATSGFAFRMWVDPTLCPSATSIWEWKQQKPWVENSGLICDYVERLWGEDAVEEERRLAAIANIRASIDRGIAAVAWDISGCEWGLIIGYDDATQILYTLRIDGSQGEVSYDSLGKMDLPILSVLTVTGRKDKSPQQILQDTKKLALAHLTGQEWCDNAKGLATYDVLLDTIRERLQPDMAWNLSYYFGTYAALKWHAWQYFTRCAGSPYGGEPERELAGLYETVYTAWKQAFDIAESNAQRITEASCREALCEALQRAKEAEERVVCILPVDAL